MPRRSINTFAAMHIGSKKTIMHIVEYTSPQNFKIIDSCSSTLLLGEETFKTGRIAFASVRELCEILKGYRRLILEYGVKNYLLSAATAIREASNQQYIVDQIIMKTGFDVQVLDIPQEIFYKYVSLYKSVSEACLLKNDASTLFVDISSGALGFTLYKDNALLYQQNINTGTLRIRESFQKSQRESLHFPKILLEYVSGILKSVQAEMQNHDIKCLVLSSFDSNLLQLLKKDPAVLNLISACEIQELYSKLNPLSLQQIIQTFNLTELEAEKALLDIIFYNHVLSMTNAAEIIIPKDWVIDGIIAYYIAEKTKDALKYSVDAQILSLLKAIGRKYKYDCLHAQQVEKWALIIFDKLNYIHGLKKRERLLLSAAAILHEIGRYVNLRKSYVHSYNLIISSDIIGFSKKEKDILANTVYYHSRGVPSDTDPNYAALDPKQKVTVAKLSAILRLSTALEKSAKHKINDIGIIFRSNEMIVKVTTREDLSLEEWFFLERSAFFEAVFGIRTKLLIQAG